MAAVSWDQSWIYGTSTTTTWDTTTSNNLLYGSPSGSIETPKRTALDWLDDRIDEVREMGRELME